MMYFFIISTLVSNKNLHTIKRTEEKGKRKEKKNKGENPQTKGSRLHQGVRTGYTLSARKSYTDILSWGKRASDSK